MNFYQLKKKQAKLFRQELTYNNVIFHLIMVSDLKSIYLRESENPGTYFEPVQLDPGHAHCPKLSLPIDLE